MAVYHLKASYGSRSGGQSALAKSDYIEREGRYAKDAEELEHKEHGNMPEWAQADPGKYWEAADQNERANGRLYSEVQFALPKELSEPQRREVAGHFAERLTGEEKLPYTLAVHRGGPEGENPHAHLMFSERGHDGIERGAEQWFRRWTGWPGGADRSPQPGRSARRSPPGRQRAGPGEGWGAEIAGGEGRGLAGADPRGVGADGEPGAGAGWPGGADRSPQPGRSARRSPPCRRPGAGGGVEPGAERPSRPGGV